MKGYSDWVAAGKPDSGLMRPLADLMALLQFQYQYTVYSYPDSGHLAAIPPEDHTMFSQTNYPGGQELWWRHAIDIMPSKGGADLYDLGIKLVQDRKDGRCPFIKYMNIPTSPALTRAIQYSWEPDMVPRTSSDTGHIHISGYTGWTDKVFPYDPFGGVKMAATTDDIMHFLQRAFNGFSDPGQPDANLVPEWVSQNQQTLQGLMAAIAKLQTDMDALKTAVAALPTGGVTATGDFPLTGSLHISSQL